ncbi:hypothetical protein B9Z65_323 [Elsinoe australis]|uniref:DUF985 domain-containing protein n=1 Tax=Elsinoe australis TaxID=40998 RepID=A0A2P7ZQ83_9PEZI|nr:hypothetical protein B9Z65_323 [Elsinoe australis]
MPPSPHYPPPRDPSRTLPLEPPHLHNLITTLSLRPHIEGGYFVETDRSPLRIPNPFSPSPSPPDPTTDPTASGTHALQLGLEASASSTPQGAAPDTTEPTTGGNALRHAYAKDQGTRSASTSILYLLTPANPQGHFHRNKARAVHSLVWGRGCYVVVHPGGEVETFVVGRDVSAGERVQWVVEGGCWKGSFLLVSSGSGEGEGGGLLVSETVVPGFEYEDHEFLRKDMVGEVLGERKGELGFLVREG